MVAAADAGEAEVRSGVAFGAQADQAPQDLDAATRPFLVFPPFVRFQPDAPLPGLALPAALHLAPAPCAADYQAPLPPK